jgi:hypothetical protein
MKNPKWKASSIFFILGFISFLIGASPFIVPASVVQVSTPGGFGVTIEGIPPFSAYAWGAAAFLIIIGAFLRVKGK